MMKAHLHRDVVFQGIVIYPTSKGGDLTAQMTNEF